MRWVLFFSTVALVAAQEIISKGGEFIAVEGKPITLECITADLNGGSILWKKNGNAIAIDEDVLDVEGTYEVEIKGSISLLTIRRVEPISSANYSCGLSEPEVEVIFQVKVHAPPVIVIQPDESIYSVRVGEENVILACHVKEGNPKPVVQWSKQAGIPSDVRRESNNARLVIPKVTKAHGGRYTCEARNIAGSTRQTIEVVVDESDANAAGEKPWVKNETPFKPVLKNSKVDISCTYDGTPVPQVEWYFNGYKINYADEKFKGTVQLAQRFNGYSKTTLNIASIKEDTFGDYACRVSNKLGTVQAVVHVSGRPGPPQLNLVENDLSWDVRAYDRVLEYQLCHRYQGQDNFLPENCQSIKVNKGDNKGDDNWEHNIDLTSYLERGATYEVQLRARNSLGWGSYAKDYLSVDLPTIMKEEKKAGNQLMSPSAAIVTLLVAFRNL